MPDQFVEILAPIKEYIEILDSKVEVLEVDNFHTTLEVVQESHILEVIREVETLEVFIPEVQIIEIVQRGQQGIPGPYGSGGSPRRVYQDAVETPDGARTIFTVPATYLATSLSVYLNGLQEFYVEEVSSTTFSFDTAPLGTDIIQLEFNLS